MNTDSRFTRSIIYIAIAAFFLMLAGKAHAAAPVFGPSVELNQAKPYSGAVKIEDIYTSKSIFGKLQGVTPVDIYSVTPDKDGSQLITVMGRKEKSPGQIAIIFIDPTTGTKAQPLQLQMPDPKYHPYVLKQADPNKTYREQLLSQDYSIYAQDHIDFKKNTTYYMVVVNADPSNPVVHYVIRLGDSQTIEVKDIITHGVSWLRLQADVYGKKTPFIFTIESFSIVLLLLGLALLVGITVIQDTFSFLANMSKSAGYILIKLQPFSRVFIWVSLWFMLIGGYMYLDRQGWVGLPFVLGVIYIIIVVNMLYQTLGIGPKVARLEVTKQEATIPFSLRKRYFLSSLVSLFSIVSFITILGMYLSGK
jgi:hypothetical protein